MTDFTRITVIGSVKKATLVLPSDEPLAALLPEIADVIDEPATASGLTLVGRLGDEVELALSTADQAVVDGSVFRLVSVADAPPPPEVSDVTAAVAETLDTATGRWSSGHRTAVTALVLGASVALIDLGAWFAPTVYVLAAVAAVLLGARGARRAAVLSAALAVGAVPATTVWLADLLGQGAGLTPVVIVELGLLLGWVALAALGGRSSLLGAAVGVVLSLLFLGAHLIGATDAEAAAILGVAVVAGLGFLPALALNASGLATLDDKVIAGVPAERLTVRSRVVEAYRLFGWAVYALAAAGAVAVTVLLADGGLWPLILGVSIAAVLVLRTRVMPLAVQAWALWGAAGLAMFLGMGPRVAEAPGTGALVLAAVMAGAVLAGTLSPRPHTRIRLRRGGDLVEGLAVLALVPAVLGIFGVYELALGAFN
ncbi:EsaB/YukD family protein [Microterricola viridarii]|uniref:Type VII secretion integral membrane protein EccD n=1 Tax=Microterricola viridarii TaxID=412690 RepID=A0A1H1NNC1_9MICO|nr:EsaB/YukD family protein [Microterricola viridarii]SDS00383.1 type VII secretion integral membrane protein EccD [Microterricola viridarii]